MPHHVENHVMAPLADVDRSRNPNSRARKTSTGGNRSWSEEEENYLLQTRMQKMPYKHIAAHLKKTELACRLHYHQLSHGSHRRKRTGSVSSSNSNGSYSSTGSSPRTQNQIAYGQEEHDDIYGAVRFGAGNTGDGSYGQHKVLLPKPMPMTPAETDHVGLGINSQMQAAIAHAHNQNQSQKNVDTNRLRQIYDSHRSTFWNAVSADYGTDASPSQLEAIWQHNGHQPVMRPSTPGDSPDHLLPSLQSSALPQQFNPYASMPYSATPRTDLSPIYQHGAVSAVSDPGRGMGYFTPMPQTNYGISRTPALSRNATWGHPQQPSAPTAIASLLTDNKCPRGSQCSDANCKNGHY